jgi:hypothetical protein
VFRSLSEEARPFAHLVPRDLRCNWVMTQSTRIYRHSAAGTDWAALLLGAGLGLTLALQATTLRSGDFKDFY